MKLMTKAIERKLPPLYAQDGLGMDAIAHLKLFTPDSSWTWYATEYDPAERRCFGWADNGAGGGELGYFGLDELEQVRGKFGLPVERDRYFLPMPLSQAVVDGVARA